MSPRTISTPIASSGAASLPSRTSADTSSPCSTSSSAMFEPIIPVEPVRNTRLMVVTSTGELGLDGGHQRRVLGRDLRAEPPHDLALRRHQELLEVPFDV